MVKFALYKTAKLLATEKKKMIGRVIFQMICYCK